MGRRLRRYFTSVEGVAAALVVVVLIFVVPLSFKVPIAFVCGVPLVVRALQAGVDRASRAGMADASRGDRRAIQRADAWKRMTVFVRRDAPRTPNKWAQGVLVRRPDLVYWRYFWRPWRNHLEIPIDELRLGLGRYSDASDLPVLKPGLFVVIPASSGDGAWNFAVPAVEATEFRLLFAAGATPSDSEGS